MKRLPQIFLFAIIALMLFVGAYHFITRKPVQKVADTIQGENIPDGENVWYIGDSYSDVDYVKAQIAEIFGDIYVNVQSGKRFGRDIAGNPSGISIVRERIATGRRPKYLIYELDTNDNDLNVEAATAEINTLRDLVGSDCYIILMTAHSLERDNSAYNSAVLRVARDDDHILVADWEAAIMGQEASFIGADLLHPNQAGHDLMLGLFKAQLDNAVALANR